MLNDFRKLALLLQPEYFKSWGGGGRKQIWWEPRVKKVHKLLRHPASCILFSEPPSHPSFPDFCQIKGRQ